MFASSVGSSKLQFEPLEWWFEVFEGLHAGSTEGFSMGSLERAIEVGGLGLQAWTWGLGFAVWDFKKQPTVLP